MRYLVSIRVILLFVLCLFFQSSATAQWGEITNWFNQAVKDVNQASKEVENSYQLVDAQVQASTQQFVNDIERFATDFANGSMNIINDCKGNSTPVYQTLESAVKAEANKIAKSTNSPSQAICDECIKHATLQFICRVPETIQGNMAFMDKMQAMAKDARVSHLQTPIKEISGVALGTFDDFSGEFQYYFNLLGSFSSNFNPSAMNMTEEQLMKKIFSKSNCEALGDQAFDSMMGALKSKAEREKAKKRYAALLKMLNGFGNMETVSGWNDNLNKIGSLLPQSEAAKNIPTENPLYNTGGAENVFINATGNSLWVDARNWSKQMVPLPYQVAYIPKGKKAHVDRPVFVRRIIDNNPNGMGIRGWERVNLTEASDYYNGHTFAIQAKHSGHYFGISGDSKTKGGNVIQWNNPDHGSHHFQLLSTGDGDGTYYIKSKWSGLMLDVFGPSVENGANLGQWTFSGWDNQKFYLEDAGGGYYIIRSKHSGKVLDVSGCQNGLGTNIQQWEEVSGAACQMFRLVPKTISGQVFFIETKMGGGKVLDKQGNSSNVYLYQRHGGANQQFHFQLAEVENGKEWYYIINSENHGYLHNQGYGVHNGTNIMTLTDHKFGNDWATMYGLEKYDDQYYYIKSRFTKNVGNGVWDGGRYFDLSDCKNDNGTNLQLYDKVDGANCQLFKLVKAN
ncbi:MAG: RICIN domain-containing protein [Ekhidna sp.]